MAPISRESTRNRKPCLTCTRVKDPVNCENKLCKDWQAWFLERWESMRRGVQELLKPVACVGEISVGGRQYSHQEHMINKEEV